MEVAPANMNPFETNRLLVELSTYYQDGTQGRRTSEMVKDYATRIISGDVQGALWLRQPDVASGVAVIDPTEGAGARVSHLYVEKPHQTTQAVSEFVEGLQEFSKENGGLYAICDEIPGLNHEQQAEVLEPRGFRHVGRLTMVYRLAQKDPPSPSSPPLGRRVHLGVDHVEGLISLFAQTFEGERDQLFAPRPGNTRESGRTFLEDFFLNLDTPPIAWGSLGIQLEEEIIGAVLAQQGYMAPADSKHLWVYDLMVAPDQQRKGLGTYLLGELLRESKSHGIEELYLEVTEGNPAEHLYLRLGFEKIAAAESARRGFWINAAVAQSLGIPL